MKEWETMTAEKAFITDLGATTTADSEQFCRFAVWIPEQEKGKHRIPKIQSSGTFKEKICGSAGIYFLCGDAGIKAGRIP